MMTRQEYLRLLDSGADSQDISKALMAREPARSEPVNWREQEHMQTNFVDNPAMGITVEADKIDRPYSQRIYPAPAYDQNGDLHCRCCGGILGRTMTGSGEGVAVCSNVGCDGNGFVYVEGSYTRNPHRGG